MGLDGELLKALEPEQFYREWMQTYFPVRPDGRKNDEYRPVSIQAGTIGTADGSALVRVGSTTVITGVKAEVSEASLDLPRRGFLVPNVHYAAGANAQSRPGPPSEEVQALTARVKECLDSLDMCDVTKLIPCEGLVWTLYIDAVVLNDDGNVWDALWLSLVSALEDVLLPEVEVDADAGMVSIKAEAQTQLELKIKPLPLTFASYKDAHLVDPSSNEEFLLPISNLLVDRNQPSVVLASKGNSSAIDTQALARSLLAKLS